MSGYRPMDKHTSPAAFWVAKYRLVMEAQEYEKNILQDLLINYTNLSHRYYEACVELEREREYNLVYRNRISQLQDAFTRDAFIVVLIDANHFVFNESFIAKGKRGGIKAATALQKAVLDYCHGQLSDLPKETKVIARVFGDLKMLSSVCCVAEIIDDPIKLENFFQGFGESNALHDFVDTGNRIDSGFAKISKAFDLHIYDSGCRQIIIGCSGQGTYMDFLKDIYDDNSENRVTLLESLSCDPEFHALPYRKIKLDDIFQDSKIELDPREWPSCLQQNGILSPISIPEPGIARFITTVDDSSVTIPPTLSPSIESSHSAGLPKVGLKPASQSKTMSWAERTKAAIANTAADLKHALPAVSSSEPKVQRNRNGQRVDPEPPRPYNKEEIKRVKALRMCNVHYLRGDCYRINCSHSHTLKPSKVQLEVLALIARSIVPCLNGSACDDPKCIYGHRCAAPVRKVVRTFGDGVNDGGKNCIFGRGCVFPPELHGLDSKVQNSASRI